VPTPRSGWPGYVGKPSTDSAGCHCRRNVRLPISITHKWTVGAILCADQSRYEASEFNHHALCSELLLPEKLLNNQAHYSGNSGIVFQINHGGAAVSIGREERSLLCSYLFFRQAQTSD